MEDTDRERSTQESYDAILELWRWLGLDWDEGIEVGGPHGPYKQSERGDIYRDVLARLRESSYTYDCFCTNDEVDRAPRGVRLEDAGLRRLLPRADRRAARRLRGRGPRAGRPLPDARRLDHVERPGPRRHHLRDRERPRLRALARQRRPALHPRQPDRRRARWRSPTSCAARTCSPARRASWRSSRRSSPSAWPRRCPPTATCPTSWARATRSSPSATPRRTRWPTASRASCPRA